MKDIIKQVAKNNGVTEEQVRAEIDFAIAVAMKNRDQSEFSRAFWNSVSIDGKKPTAEEFIRVAALNVWFS